MPALVTSFEQWMAAEIRLTKSGEKPWGFRLTGGRDFGTPLTIIKVAAHSVAEEAGLQVGDILVKINNVDTHGVTHKEAQELIVEAKDSVSFSVLRGNLFLPEETIERLTPLPLRDFKTPEPAPIAQVIHPDNNTSCNNIEKDKNIVQNIEIRDLDPYQLEELGLAPLPEDFLEKAKRDASPMPEVRPQSVTNSVPDVLETLEEMGLHDVVEEIERQKEQLLHEESAETEEIDQPGFVVELEQICPPNTAVEPMVPEATQEEQFVEIMSGKAEVLEGTALGVDFKKFEPQADFLKKSQVFQTIQETDKHEKEKRWTTFLEKPNRPIIKPKPKVKTAVEEAAAPPAISNEVLIAESEKHGIYEIPSEEEFATLIRVPTPISVIENEIEQNKDTNNNEIIVDNGKEVPEIECLVEDVKRQLEAEEEDFQQQILIEKENPEMIGEKTEIELQLEEIQRQLQSIQQLPFEIQQHLQLVQEQLNNIVQHRSREQECEIPPAPRPSMVEETPLPEEDQELKELNEEIPGDLGDLVPTSEELLVSCDKPSEEEPTEQKPEEICSKEEPEEEQTMLNKQQVKKRPFNGIGPAPRPLILPGGRKWRTPKDAYNDEFIAETLSAQAEIITGTTLGVNFRKYEPKHPNLEHLRDSIVYKMIHDLEDPKIVFASRPEIIPAIQDYPSAAL